jgi:cell division protease FtsH
MSEELGPVAYESYEENSYPGRELGPGREYGEFFAGVIDREVRRLISSAEDRAAAILSENADLLDHLAGRLEEEETLTRDRFEAVVGRKVRAESVSSQARSNP